MSTTLSVAPREATHAKSAECTNCGKELVDVFCASCGEKQPDHHDYSVSHFLGHAFHEIVHLDSKVITTLRYLVTRPGFLTAEYFAGRKTRYISPLRVFLVLFALQFLAYSARDDMSLYSSKRFLAIESSRGQFEQLFKKVETKTKLDRAQMIERLDDRWRRSITAVQLLNVVVAGFALLVVWRRRYLVEHLVFAAHYLSFSYIFTLALWPVYWYFGLDRVLNMGWPTLITLGLTFAYFTLAIRRFYGDRGGKLALKAVVGYGLLFLANMLVFYIPWIYALVSLVKLRASA